MAKHFVVTGATGNIGTALVQELLRQGHHVTAVARPSTRLDTLAQAGATPRAGNLHDAAFLTDALRGADAAFLMIPPSPTAPDVLGHMQQVGEAVAEAVRASGLPQAVHLSSIGADLPAGTGPVVGLYHQEARLNAVQDLHVLHLRPAYFMENLLVNIGLIQHMGIAGSAIRADLAFPMVATRDIAARAAEALQAGVSGRNSQLLLGPRNYTMQDVVAALGAALGRPDLPYVQFSYEDAQRGMVQAGLSENMASLYDEMTRNMNAGTAMVQEERTPAATTPTTMAEFAQTVFAPAFQRAAAAQPAQE